MQRVLIITDCADVAANELHATLVTNLEKYGSHAIVEPAILTEPFSVIQGDFLARLITESYTPENLTILSVINPLNPAAHKRARIAVRLKNGMKLVGPNTGVFSWLIEDFGIEELVESDNRGLKGKSFISFGGKYAHAPVAAKFAATNNINSVKVNDFAINDLVTLEHPMGQVVHIDNFGVSKILLKEIDAKYGDILKLCKNGTYIEDITYCASMKELADGVLGLYPGSSLGLLEVGRVRKLHASAELGIKIGDILEFKK